MLVTGLGDWKIMTDTPIKVGHCYTNKGGVDKYRTLVWKKVFQDEGIPIHNFDEEYGEMNVGYVSHPVARGRYARAVALKQKGLPVVMQVDDDYKRIPEENRAYETTRGAWDYLIETAEISEVVVVTTDKLAEEFEPYNDNVLVIPNYIPDDALIPKGAMLMQERHGRFGWAGSLETHPGDLDVLQFAVRDLVFDHGYEFHHVGQGGISPVLNAPVYEHGKVTTEDYIDKIFETFDIGLAPLCKIEFNEAKSNLKLIEYSALGVPWVASPRREYLRTHREHNVGLLASKPSQWKKHVIRLFEDDDFYNEQRLNNWEWASKRVISKHYHKWIEAFELALKLDKRLPRPYHIS